MRPLSRFLRRACRRRCWTRRHVRPWLQPRADRLRVGVLRRLAEPRDRNCSGSRRFCGGGFAEQGGHFRIGQGWQAFAAAARLFGGNGGLAPLVSLRDPLGDFRADGAAGRFCRRRRRRCGRSGGRGWRAGLNWFTQQGRHFRIVQRRQALAATARLLGGDGGLAPLVSLRDPFGDFFADASRGCGRRVRGRRSRALLLEPGVGWPARTGRVRPPPPTTWVGRP